MPPRNSNYIPRADGDFNAWQRNYIAQVSQWFLEQGIGSPLLDAAIEASKEWDLAYPAHITAQAAAQGARSAKDDARAAYEAAIRPLTSFLQSNPAMSDALRAGFGITVHDPSRTPAPRPTTRPLVSVDPAARLTHRLRLVDEASPTRRGKPRGVTGAEVWVKMVDAGQPAPTDPAALSFLTLTTRGTLRTEFPEAAGGKTAVYMLRWVNTRGEKGPWSDIAAATVAA